MISSELLMRMSEYIPDPSLSKNHLTGTPLDLPLSQEGGLPPAVIYLLSGPPGVGKSTLALTSGADMLAMNPDLKVLYISGEMSCFELKKVAERFPKINDLPVLFLPMGAGTAKITKILPAVLRRGWDVVYLDSYDATKRRIQFQDKVSSGAAEQFLLTLLQQQTAGMNDREVRTSVIMLQGETKSGSVRGSQRLVHDVTSHLQLKIDNADDPFSGHYLVFKKHRRGVENIRMHYDLHEGGDIYYDLEGYLEDVDRGMASIKNRYNKSSLSAKLDSIFQKNYSEEKLV